VVGGHAEGVGLVGDALVAAWADLDLLVRG
jgi:hypothetical protein